VHTARKGKQAPADPWDARTLEWLTTNPPKPHNFDRIPVVHHLDEFFHRKYEEDAATHTMRQVKTGEDLIRAEEEAADAHIHMPSPSYWPLVLSVGVGVLGLGIIYGAPIMVVGAAIVLLASYGWALEPSTAEDIDFASPSDGGHTKEIATHG
jgi:cytochrome c oxidase subunit 1